MDGTTINYDTFIKISNAISHSRDPDEIILMTVEGITSALDIKGCALFLLNEEDKQLEVAGSYGLSQEYLNKGPISSLHSIAQSLKDGPIAIFDVVNDPRLQYPEAAQKEGIASILSVPIYINDSVLGALRVYSADPWKITIKDVNFVNGLAQIAGLAISAANYTRDIQNKIDDFTTVDDVQAFMDTRTTPYEGVPQSFPSDEYHR